MRDTPELEANKSESEKKFSQPDEALPLHESKEFNVTTASATCVEVLEENIKNHLLAVDKMNKQALEYSEANPGASVKTSATFTGVSIRLFNSDDLRKIIENAKATKADTPTP